MKKLLCIMDSPTVPTGFGIVGGNLLKRWQKYFERIDVWAINYTGWPHEFPYQLFPAASENPDWQNVANLRRLLNLILEGDYTHIFLMGDTFCFSRNQFPKHLRLAIEKSKTKPKFIIYFPVDAPMEKEWLEIVQVADLAATYTEYGRAMCLKAIFTWDGPPPLKLQDLKVIPHGVDTSVFRPLPADVRAELRKEIFSQIVPAREQNEWKTCGHLILLNVNRNERRKGMAHSLQVLKRLQNLGVPSKLLLHCPAENPNEGIDLRKVGEQIGVIWGRDWIDTAQWCRSGVGHLDEGSLNELYNSADILLTTTLGEGWGMSITEAAASGMPVVLPTHTSCPSIAQILSDRAILVPLSDEAIVAPHDNSRVRYPISVDKAAQILKHISRPVIRLPELSDEVKRQLSWARIAEKWISEFEGLTTKNAAKEEFYA